MPVNQPCYFGPTDAPRFGMLHRPSGASRGTAVLLCPSWGSEGLRSHRGLRLLAQALAARGFPALRFDFRGSGDSAGDGRTVTLDDWLDDLQLAAALLAEETGNRPRCLFGLRSGALLAQEAVARARVTASAVALWDPPPSGAIFVANLQQMDRAWNDLSAQRRRPESQLAAPARDELLGHDWPAALANALAALPGLRDDLPQRFVFTSRDRIPPDGVDVLRLPDAGHWSDVDRIHAPWQPAASIAQVADHLAERLE